MRKRFLNTCITYLNMTEKQYTGTWKYSTVVERYKHGQQHYWGLSLEWNRIWGAKTASCRIIVAHFRGQL